MSSFDKTPNKPRAAASKTTQLPWYIRLVNWFGGPRLAGAKTAAPVEICVEDATPALDQTPDLPQPFGYKVSWFAVRTDDATKVIDALGLAEAAPANWASGLAMADRYSREGNSWLFVSPPVNGWVFAVSSSLPYPIGETHDDVGRKFDALLSRLMARFDDVQFFGSYRVTGFCAWARALNGKPERMFAYNDGQVLTNFGDQTPDEAKLGFPDLSGLSLPDADDKIFAVAEEQSAEEERLVAAGISWEEALAKIGRSALPDEEDVVELAALWSIDPTQLSDQDHQPGLGFVARLPEDMRQ
jgi:hypothetical protein